MKLKVYAQGSKEGERKIIEANLKEDKVLRELIRCLTVKIAKTFPKKIWFIRIL